MNPYYTDYAEYLSRYFGNRKIQKLSVNAGFSCPNRDGTIGRGGCAYCDNSTFTPSYCKADDPIGVQLAKGREFFMRKYPDMSYLAYFQSFTNTHGRTTKQLRGLYEEALAAPGVVGLIIGTRPDTFGDDVAGILGDMARHCPVFVELGAESSCDGTLQRVNRGHKWNDTCEAARRASKAGLHVGLHLIAGLPGESHDRILQSVDDACELPIESLKLHQLQVITDTPLHRQWLEGKAEIEPMTLEKYVGLCAQVVSRVPRHIAIERFVAQAPPDRVVTPRWGIKNYQFTNLLMARLKETNRQHG